MDSIDAVFYKKAEAPERLISAYQFFNSDDGKVILEDLIRYCGWGPQDPTVMNGDDAKAILAMQRIVWRIKAMLNSIVETKQGDNNE